MSLEKYYSEWNHDTDEEMERLKNNIFNIEFILSCGDNIDKIELCNKLRKDFYIIYREEVIENTGVLENNIIEEIKKKFYYIINEFNFEIENVYYQNPEFLLQTISEFYELIKKALNYPE